MQQFELCEEKTITVYEESYDICRVLLKERRKKRFEILGITISIMRILMLMKSLKISGYHKLLKLQVFELKNSGIINWSPYLFLDVGYRVRF
jgi:hypothetical protein